MASNDTESPPDVSRLTKLWLDLLSGAYHAQGAWVHRLLPRGALLAVRVRREDMTAELRIAREHAQAGAPWDREVATFLAHWPRRHGRSLVEVEPDPPAKPESIARQYREVWKR